jgi:hypothetical protein
MARLNHLPGKPDGESQVQIIRNLTWRLIAIAFIGLLFFSLLPFFIDGGAGFTPLPVDTFYGACAAIVIGFIVPLKFLKVPETLNHEVGHALAASLMGLSVRLIRVEKDMSGVTSFSGKYSRFRSLIVSAAGPLGTASFFVFTAALISDSKAILWILFTLGTTLLIAVTTVRSWWGWVSAILVIATLWQSLLISIQIGSGIIGNVSIGIWTASTWNLAILISAYCCGISIRYSIQCRRPRSESQDEAKVARALGLHPTLGGYLILILNLALVFTAMTIIMGWANPWTPIPFP